MRGFGLLALVLVGCGQTQTGDSATLRFGLIYQYPESDGFVGIAQSHRLPLALQSLTKPALLNDYEYLDGTLTVSYADGSQVDVTAVEKGKFEARFDRAGQAVLQGEYGGKKDTLGVVVVPVAELRLSTKLRTISTTDGTKTCSETLAEGAALPALKKNQVLHTALVPIDASGQPLLGAIDFWARGTLPMTEDPKVTGAWLNGVTFASTTAGPHSIIIGDRASLKELTVELQIEDALATCP